LQTQRGQTPAFAGVAQLPGEGNTTFKNTLLPILSSHIHYR
jgi:hypothetical protein